MTSNIEEATKKKLPLLRMLAGGVLSGVIGYGFGQYLSGIFPKANLPETLQALQNPVMLASFVITIFVLTMCFIPAFMFGAANFSERFAKNPILTRSLGSAQTAKRAFLPLSIFCFANGILLCNLWILTLLPTSTMGSWFWLLLSLACGLAMAWTAVRLLAILDELFRAVWIESIALSAGIVLVAGMIVQSAVLGGLMRPLPPLTIIVAFHAVYFVVSFVLTYQKDPDIMAPDVGSDA